MLWRGEWTGTYEYDSLDVVAASDGNYYVSNGKNINKQPQSNPGMWSKMIDMSAVEAAKRAAQGAAGTAIEEARKIQPAIDNMEAIVNDKVAELDTYGDKVTYLLHLFGQYATPAPQSLLIDPTRRDVAISAESMSEVAAQGWAISQPIVIRKGNIYRIKVGEASGQYVTTAMRYQYRDEQGNLRYAYKRKTQLDEHSELPVDGYLIMYGLPRDYELVVCFKYTAQYDPVVEVLTAGLLRTLAFQLGDMQDMIDQKLDVNGHSSAASVGGAMALLQKGDVPEDTYSELLTARMIGNAPDLMHVHGSTDTRTGIDDGKDVNVVVEKVWGDCIVGNQMVPINDYPDKSITKSEYSVIDHRDGTFTIQTIATGVTSYISVCRYVAPSGNVYKKGHGYLVLSGTDKANKDTLLIGDDFNVSVSANGYAGLVEKYNYYGSSSIGIALRPGTILAEPTKVTCLLLDLTLLFPTDPDFVTSLTSTDAIKVAHRLGFSAFTLD